MWFLETSLAVFMAVTRENKVIVPVLEFDKIGKDGNFNAPFTYSLEYMKYESLYGSSQVRVSRNKVPKVIKDYFREFYRSGEEKREGAKQEEVGLVPAKEGA
jgi:hypothetical protein